MNRLEGTGPPPASKENIDKIPTVTIDSKHVGKKIYFI
jgi:hypothetical protein